MASQSMRKHATPAPQPITRLWVRTLISLTASVAIGLAPFLGTLNIPLFSPLLSLIPIQIQKEAITLSTSAMSLVAIAVQWGAGVNVNLRVIEKRFKRILVIAAITFILLFTVSNFLVVRVPYLDGSRSASFLKGFRRPIPDPCSGKSDESCVQSVLSFDEAKLAGYWGNDQIALARFAYLLFYVALMAQFGALVGFLVLRDGIQKPKKQPQVTA